MSELLEQTIAPSIALPESDGGRYPHVYIYLSNLSVPLEVVKKLIADEVLYQDVRHRAIFITPKHDFMEIHDTAKRDPEEDIWEMQPDTAAYWYFLPAGKDVPIKAVYVLKSAVDAVVLYAYHKRTGMVIPAAYVSVGSPDNQKSIDSLYAKFGKHVVLLTDKSFVNSPLVRQ